MSSACGWLVGWAMVVSGQPAVSAEVSQDGVVSFKLGTAEVTRYHAHSKVAKPYFWPVITPGGVAVTRDWPMVPEAKEAKDHKHQKSAWFCHGDVVLEGYQAPKRKGIEGVDFWSEETGHGTIVATAIAKPTPSGQGSVTVRTSNIWKDSTGKAILTEARTLVFRSRDASSWVMEVTSEITASEGGIVFEDTKEGSFGVRVRDDPARRSGPLRRPNRAGSYSEAGIAPCRCLRANR